MSKDLQLRDDKYYEAGAGMWFRNSDNTQIIVKCQLYPKVRLWFDDERRSHDITKQELEASYHRLRV